MITLRARLASLIAAAAVVCICSAALQAHPAGSTLVAIARVDASHVQIKITADPAALAAKLNALSREPAAAGDAIAQVRAQSSTLLEHVRLAGTASPGAIELNVRSVEHGRDDSVVVTLDAELPPHTAMVRWQATFIFGAYPVVVSERTEAEAVWLQGSEMSAPLALDHASSTSFAKKTFERFVLGFTHILPNGIDHILFVLGLFLLSRRRRDVLIQVSAFTLAHSITLGLTLYGKVSLPASVVEPLIAISIAYVAIENLFTSEVKTWRVALVFLFGLLHGMGFAEALAKLDLPRSEFLSTLITFNVGVEAGQLTVIAVAALLVWASRIQPADYRRLVARPVSVGIAGMGVFWTVARIWKG